MVEVDVEQSSVGYYRRPTSCDSPTYFDSALRIESVEPILLHLRNDSEADLLLANDFAQLLAVDEVDSGSGGDGSLTSSLRVATKRHEYRSFGTGSGGAALT